MTCAYGRIHHGPGYLRPPCAVAPTAAVVWMQDGCCWYLETCDRHRPMLERYLTASCGAEVMRWTALRLH